MRVSPSVRLEAEVAATPSSAHSPGAVQKDPRLPGTELSPPWCFLQGRTRAQLTPKGAQFRALLSVAKVKLARGRVHCRREPEDTHPDLGRVGAAALRACHGEELARHWCPQGPSRCA